MAHLQLESTLCRDYESDGLVEARKLATLVPPHVYNQSFPRCRRAI